MHQRLTTPARPALLALAIAVALAGAPSASATSPPELARVDAASDRLDGGSLADAVRAAAILAQVAPSVREPVAVDPPRGVPAALAAPVADLLAAIEQAGAETTAAIKDPAAVRETGSELSDLLVRAATSPPDREATRRLAALHRAGQGAVDVPRLFGAGITLAEAIDATLPVLRSGIALPAGDAAGCDVVDQAPRLCIGGTGANTLSADADLVIDLGGNDLHTHSAGGAGGTARPAAVTIDLGGNDRYEATAGPAQGAGNLGIGMLVDLAGNDTYSVAATSAADTAYGQGTNFSAGGGLLADLGGSDRYVVTSTKPEGALAVGHGRGAQPGFGILLDDGSGEDEYLLSARPSALIETEDEVKVGGLNANGMGFGAIGGVGILDDRAGGEFMTLETISPTVHPGESRPITSVPVAGPQGLGGGSTNGVGFVRSGTGQSIRRAIGSMQAPWSGIETINAFGWSVNGTGVLRDGGGDDTYWAEAVSHAAREITIDDSCECEGAHAEARQSIPNVGAASVRGMGASIGGLGMLQDLGVGNDIYRAEARAFAEARVVDERTVNTGLTQATAVANHVSVETQGFGAGGAGVLEDEAGDDTYQVFGRSWSVATARADKGAPTEARARTGTAFTTAQGGGTSSGAQPGSGVLRDHGGADTYEVDSDTTALSVPFTERTKGPILSSAQGSVAGNSTALFLDRDAGLDDTFILSPADPACEGTRGEGTWRDCGMLAGIGIVDDDPVRAR